VSRLLLLIFVVCTAVATDSIGELFVFRFAEANARQQLLEHLGFHADTIEKAAVEFDIVKGLESMSVEEKSKAPMVSQSQRVATEVTININIFF
jgi:hypothetical protein